MTEKPYRCRTCGGTDHVVRSNGYRRCMACYKRTMTRLKETGWIHQNYRKNHLRSKFGITQAQYDLMFQEQGGRCAICKRPQEECGAALAVDHCHRRGTVRGLLCTHCNTSIGKFEDSPETLIAAYEYLLTHSQGGEAA